MRLRVIVAVAVLAAGEALDEGALGSGLLGSAAGAADGGVDGVVLYFLYEFTAGAGGAGFSTDGSGFFSTSSFFADSVMLMERT